VEDLNRVDVQDLKNFFLRWYGPNNATLTIGGDFKSADVIKLVDKYFGSIHKCPEVSKTILPKVKLNSDRYASYVDNYARVPMLMKTCIANEIAKVMGEVIKPTVVQVREGLLSFD
jgi:zinc protease